MGCNVKTVLQIARMFKRDIRIALFLLLLLVFFVALSAACWLLLGMGRDLVLRP